VSQTVQLSLGGFASVKDMKVCSYCGKPATVRIFSDPEQVCVQHAIEFWTGLLAYTRERSARPDRRRVLPVPRVFGGDGRDGDSSGRSVAATLH